MWTRTRRTRGRLCPFSTPPLLPFFFCHSLSYRLCLTLFFNLCHLLWIRNEEWLADFLGWKGLPPGWHGFLKRCNMVLQRDSLSGHPTKMQV